MNTILNANQIENSDLRELSHTEQIKVSGGAACYQNPQGSQNFNRFRVSSRNTISQEVFRGGRWVFFRQFGRDVSFSAFCRRGNFNFFF
jgi:hypothetical protein